jgi:hypothetical protein
MSFRDCVREGARVGVITPDAAQRLYKRIDELERLSYAPPEIRQRILDEMTADEREKRRVGLLQGNKSLELIQTIMSHKDARGRPAPHKALWMLIEHFGHMGSKLDAQHLMDTIVRRAQEEVDNLLWEFRKGYLTGEMRRKGPELTARLENIVRELFGQDTGDIKAKQFGQAWAAVAEKLRLRFNEAGGAIRVLEKWGLPQHHSAEAMLSAGGHKAGSAEAKDAWIKFVTPLLDRERMLSPLTGTKLSDAELADSLSHVYDTIITEGWSKREPALRPQGSGALYKQHADHRFLHFKDADSWLQYQKAFGQGDILVTLTGHIRSMARDIAAMEVLGPNPEAMLSFLSQSVIKSMGHGPEVSKALNKLESMWAHYKGAGNVPVSDNWAKVMAAARNYISSTALGSAAITALSDHATDAVTRTYVGLPVLKTFTGWLQQMGPGAERHAERNGLILSSAMSTVFEEARFWGSTSARTVSSYINDRVLSFSGLNAMTEGRKAAFGLDFQATAADLARYSWDDLGAQNDAFRRTLERHGFDAADWDKIRIADQEQPSRGDGFVGPAGPDGTGFLRAQEIEKVAGRELADRYHAMILKEMKHGIIESTLASRSAIIGTNQPGTFTGELLRSGGQFKGFGVGFMMLHGERIFRDLAGENKARGAVYAGALLITATLFGGLALQLKEIANGRDPRRMDMSKYGAKFWGSALLQGGGLGIYGDFLFSDVNRFGGSLAATIAGPMAGRIDDLRRLTIGNALEYAQGDDKTNFGRELSNMIRSGTPGFSSWWFAREAWNRVLMDQMQYMMDPEAHAAFRRQVQRRRTDYRQDFWWRPGEMEPRRGPDFGAMFP